MDLYAGAGSGPGGSNRYPRGVQAEEAKMQLGI